MCLGIPGQVIEITDADKRLGLVDVGGVRRVTNLACVLDGRPVEACVGDWVLVHVGFAMSRIDPEEAARTLALLEELGEIQDELRQMKESAGAPGGSTRPGGADG
ncbi:MAG: HypC/HybG/HupF family hydrogenase formation chaperone [Sandaracinaceae bacterium]